MQDKRLFLQNFFTKRDFFLQKDTLGDRVSFLVQTLKRGKRAPEKACSMGDFLLAQYQQLFVLTNRPALIYINNDHISFKSKHVIILSVHVVSMKENKKKNYMRLHLNFTGFFFLILATFGNLQHYPDMLKLFNCNVKVIMLNRCETME